MVWLQLKQAMLRSPPSTPARNIALTRRAYNLNRIAAKPFAAEQKLYLPPIEGPPRQRLRLLGSDSETNRTRAISPSPLAQTAAFARCGLE
jgi:hypothetical protein